MSAFTGTIFLAVFQALYSTSNRRKRKREQEKHDRTFPKHLETRPKKQRIERSVKRTSRLDGRRKQNSAEEYLMLKSKANEKNGQTGLATFFQGRKFHLLPSLKETTQTQTHISPINLLTKEKKIRKTYSFAS